MAQKDSWFKKNWFSLLVVILLILYLNSRGSIQPLSVMKDGGFYPEMGMSEPAFTDLSVESSRSILPPEPGFDVAPTDSDERLVITDTFLSMVVKDVTQAVVGIRSSAEDMGGFLVNSSVNTPEEGGTGQITVRVPSDRLGESLIAFKEVGVRVVSEDITGTDVTDQYEDLNARLETLNATKAKFNAILTSANRIEDILQVQRELVNLQRQIDSVIGRQEFLEKSASLSAVTVYLSTDELSLPYAPDNLWRPSVIFKTAVRSLVETGRGIVNGLIWVVVYAPIWLPILLIWRRFTGR
jgi:hypothetical protein